MVLPRKETHWKRETIDGQGNEGFCQIPSPTSPVLDRCRVREVKRDLRGPDDCNAMVE